MAATIVQLSDTHLSRRHAYFHRNWRQTVDAVNDLGADLVVTTGDLSVNGSDDDDDLEFAIDEHERLLAPWRVLPGNHDIGEEPGAELLGQPVDAQRLARWDRIAGEDHWSIDLDGWRLIGLDGLVFGTRSPREQRQRDWLVDELRAADGPIGLFLHKPLWVDSPADADGHLVTPRRQRRWLLDLVTRHDVRFVATGHLHRARVSSWSGVTMVWAPSCAFPASEPRWDASAPLGYVRHTLDGDRHRAEIVELPQLERHDLAAIKGEQYEFLHQTPSTSARALVEG